MANDDLRQELRVSQGSLLRVTDKLTPLTTSRAVYWTIGSCQRLNLRPELWNILQTFSVNAGCSGDTNRSSNEAFQPRRFTTYDRDGNSSDEAMHRRYNRWHSRFDQPDPYGGSYDLTNPQSFNRYSYVQNDPVNFVDPTGLCPEGTVAQPDARGEMQCAGVGVQSVNINISGGERSGGVGGTSSGAIEIETSGNGPTEAEIIPRTQENPLTDCQRFANMVAEIAARHETTEGFMDEMARTFTAANNSSRQEMSQNLEKALPPDRIKIGDGGFKGEYRDGTNLQVRHFVGGLLYGYRYGAEGPLAASAVSELITPPPAGNMPDAKLNVWSMSWGAGAEPRPATVTGHMGVLIKKDAHPGFKGLADAIRTHICE